MTKKLRKILIFCAILIVTLFLFVGFASQSERKIPIYRVATSEKRIAISFDCAWGADKTQEIIQVLKESDAKATFFMVSFWAEKYPELVEEIVMSGFEVGNHSKTHPHFSKLSKEQQTLELEESRKIIENIAGKKVEVFRAPFGEYTNTMMEICQENSQKVIQWDVDTLDWKGNSAGEISNRIISKVQNGSIVLMHNNSDNVVSALKLALPKLKEMGYEITSVSQLVYKDSYIIDANGEQHSTREG